MLQVTDLSLRFGARTLFQDVNLAFTPGNCYGVIGANGAGKSTFLKILAGELDPTSGQVVIPPHCRVSTLKQDQFAYDSFTVLDAVIKGHNALYDILKERDALYTKSDFSEADGLRAAELEEAVGLHNGYEAETNAAILLNGLGIPEADHQRLMKDLSAGPKVRVLVAQALFENPDILLMDEPTNQLDLESILWLEEFLINCNNTVVIVSHDRHFLNQVCTHTTDIDFGKIQVYVGNYDFWYEASQMMSRQKRDETKRRADRSEELKAFIQRFSSNASKARQATSRKKLLEKLAPEDLPRTTRKFPYVEFKPLRECGKTILEIEDLSKTLETGEAIRNLRLSVEKEDKIILTGQNDLVKTTLFEILAGRVTPDSGSFRFGTTILPGYFPKDHSALFARDLNLVDWLRQYSEEKKETYIRGFLGRMLFSGEEALKSVTVLSGGEKVRCLLSMLMLSGANFLILDEPTNHLDLEAITALNQALIRFPGPVLFTSHDHQFIDTIANRIIEWTPSGIIDKSMRFDDYIRSPEVRSLRDSLYHAHVSL